jgi:hypothetical protein
VPARDSRFTKVDKPIALFAGVSAKPSDGLEPSTPSLPCAPFGNWSQPMATVLACFGRFQGRSICHQLPPVAPALLHKCSIRGRPCRQHTGGAEGTRPPHCLRGDREQGRHPWPDTCREGVELLVPLRSKVAQARGRSRSRAFGECRAARNGRHVRLILERDPERHMRGTIDPRRGGWVRQADPSSGALVGHCHDRSRSFDLSPSPSLAALVWT